MFGLTGVEAGRRLAAAGPNEIPEVRGRSAWAILQAQFANLLTILLLVATALSALLGHGVEAAAITVIVLFSVGLGFVQEYRAGRALDALRQMAAPNATVVRDGREMEIPALPVGDRRNMVFAGTTVSRGRGQALVVATGMAAEFGQIAHLLEAVESRPTPVQQNLQALGRTLARAALLVVAVIVAIGVIRGQPLIQFVKAFNFRSDRRPGLDRPFANRWLHLAVAWELVLLCVVVEWTAVQGAFGTTGLAAEDWGLVALVALTVGPVLELTKWMARRGWLGPLD